MIKVSDIVGSLVRSVTLARIQADMISSQASLEYLKDPVLRAYPVPRAEIQKADIALKLAVIDVAQTASSAETVSLRSLTDAVPGFVDRVFALPNVAGGPTRLGDGLGPNLFAAKVLVRDFLNGHIAQNLTEWTQLAETRPMDFAFKVHDMTMQAVENARHQLAPGMVFDDRFSQLVLEEARAWGNNAASAQKLASDVAGTAGFELDLAVKREDVTTLPEHLISEIRLTVVVDNYEWTTATDAQGNIVNKLSHK